MFQVSPMDEEGYFSYGLNASHLQALCEKAEIVILEVNKNHPRCLGGNDTRIHISQVDMVVESENPPLKELGSVPATEIDRAVARQIVEQIPNGACLQLGIGGMPDAVAERLMDRQDLGIYTEMLGSAMGKLMACGAVTNSRKKFYRNRSIAAFTWGSKDLYEYINANPMVELLPVHYVNDPFNIAKNENMVSVNTALEIDLTGQICSETINGKQYSGTGGAWDFAYGAFHAENGRGIIALQSTAKGGTISRIVPQLTAGSVVSIPRNIVDMVVTEYGIARLRGKSIRQRVEELIAVAHPDFRAELRAQANKLQIW